MLRNDIAASRFLAVQSELGKSVMVIIVPRAGSETDALLVPRPSNTCINAFLTAVTGMMINFREPRSRSQYETYVTFIRFCITTYDSRLLSAVLYGNFEGSLTLADDGFNLMAELAKFTRIQDAFTIDEAINDLITKNRIALLNRPPP